MKCNITRPAAGLTLIELLIAVALLALLTVMAYRGIDSMSRTSQHSLAEGDRWQAVALFFERFANDVAQPARRPVRDGNGDAKPLPEWWGRQLTGAAINDAAAAQLEFSRKSPAGRDEIRLGYRLRAGKVELLIWNVLDRAPSSQPEVYVLLEDVSSLNFRYLDASGQWQDVWPVAGSVEALPRAVAVEMDLGNGVKLHRVFALPS
ncbi:MAG: type II secretion system minor pseudopilin GspJ [Betaproteobacteria bacterium]|nr:type II secretion system minor pseudopilin GspJ [Betaproteobacteria bacterium]